MGEGSGLDDFLSAGGRTEEISKIDIDGLASSFNCDSAIDASGCMVLGSKLDGIILSSLIKEPSLTRNLNKDVFFRNDSAEIFKIMCALFEKYQTYDITALSVSLNGIEQRLNDVSGINSDPKFISEYIGAAKKNKKRYASFQALYEFNKDSEKLKENIKDGIVKDPNDALLFLRKRIKELSEANASENSIPVIHIADVKTIELEYQIEKIWIENSVGFISGLPGAHKTWFSLEMAVAVASGTKALGEFNAKPGRVISFNAEDDPSRITKARIAALAKARNVTLQELDFHLMNVFALQIDQEEIQARIEVMVRDYKPALIILDPLRNLHSLDENSASDMAPMLDFSRRIQREYSCSVLLICHDRKANKDDKRRESQTRGSNALEGWRDCAIYLDAESDKIGVTTYHRGGPPPAPFCFRLAVREESGRLEEANLEFLSTGSLKHEKKLENFRKIKDVICASGPLTRDQIVKETGLRRTDCLDLIKEMLKSRNELKEVPSGKKTLIDIQNEGSIS